MARNSKRKRLRAIAEFRRMVKWELDRQDAIFEAQLARVWDRLLKTEKAT